VGVLVFVFYQYNPSPLNFNPAATSAVLESSYADDYRLLQKAHDQLAIEKKIAQDRFSAALDIKEYDATVDAKENIIRINEKDKKIREKAKTLISQADSNTETNDKDYVFIHFILNYLPKGLIGLLLAVILSAAMSSTAAELNALGTITSLDIFKRHTDKNSEKPQEFYVSVAKWFTLLWGIIAIVIACFINLFDNLIQLVNIIGSIFYGNVLGIFLLAFFVKFVKGHAVFIAAIVTQLLIFLIYYSFIYIFPSGEEKISYLLLNLIGCVLVMTISCFFQLFDNMLKLSEEK
jgi:Na+(H+)/acetate symporter ActP